MRRKFLSVMLAAVLCISLLAVPVWAEPMEVETGTVGNEQLAENGVEVPEQDSATGDSGKSENTDEAPKSEGPGSPETSEISAASENAVIGGEESSSVPESTDAKEADQQEIQTMSTDDLTGEQGMAAENAEVTDDSAEPESTDMPGENTAPDANAEEGSGTETDQNTDGENADSLTGEPTSDAAIVEGPAGETVTYRLDKETGVITFSGTGEISVSEELSDLMEETSVIDIIIEDGITSIEDLNLHMPRMMEKIVIPDTVTQLGRGEFRFSSNLTSVRLPNALEKIPESAFAYCGKLREIEIPSTVTEIDEYAFAGCESLPAVNLPEGLRILGECVFGGCMSLTEVTIPSTTTEIGDLAFGGCLNLTTVNLPEGLQSIGAYAFQECDSLKSVVLPRSLQSIGEYAFGYSGEEYDPAPPLRDDFTIYGYAGSSAEKYSSDYSVPFVAISGWESTENGDYYSYVIEPSASSLTYTLNSEGNVVIKSSGRLQDFVRLLVDGQEVDSSNYTKAEGSTILTLLSSYLDTLSVGDHPARLEYTNGAAECTITIQERSGAAVTDTPQPTDTPQTTNTPQAAGGGTLTSAPIVPAVQTATITMLMVDTDGNPAGSLSLELHSTPQSAVTDSSGYATFNKVESGQHTLIVKDRDGKETASKKFELAFGSTVSVNGDKLTIPAGSRYVLKVRVSSSELEFLSATQANAAATGDPSRMMFWIILAAAAFVVLGGSVLYIKKREA